MAKNKYQRKKHTIKPDTYYWALRKMLPVMLMIGVVPLITRQYEYENGLTQFAWYHNNEISVDFFLAWKSVILMFLAFIMAGCVCIRCFKMKQQISFLKLIIPLLGYGFFVLLSSFFSVNKTFSFIGSFEQFETVWALLSYVLVVYYVFLYAESTLELQVITDGICFGSTVIGLLGTLQGIGIDLFATKLFQKLITTERFLQEAGGELQVKFSDNHAVITLYNPNYVGVYCSLVIPFLTMMILFEKNKWRRTWHAGNIILMIITLLSSHSRAGLIATVLALCVTLVFAVRKILKWWFLTIPAINFAVVLVLLVNAYNDNLIFERLKNILTPDQTTVAEEIAEDGTYIKRTGLTELYTTTEGIAFKYNEVSIQISFYSEAGSFGFYAEDAANQQVELLTNEDATEFFFAHPALSDITLSPVYVGDRIGFRLRADGEWNFVYNTERGRYQYITGMGKESDMIMADSLGFENYQRVFSGRGYIWSRTIPILKEHIILGSGPDTFVLEFPQEDYLKMKQNGYQNAVMTKPHSWYLQVGVQTGVISLLCLLVFYSWYAIESIRLYAFKKLHTQTEAFGIAAFIGSIGYMISGISNDSMVVTAPIFWGMIGLGITSNVLVKQTRNREA